MFDLDQGLHISGNGLPPEKLSRLRHDKDLAGYAA